MEIAREGDSPTNDPVSHLAHRPTSKASIVGSNGIKSGTREARSRKPSKRLP
jgi:hypothetical protein